MVVAAREPGISVAIALCGKLTAAVVGVTQPMLSG